MSSEGFRLLQRECINTGLCYECGLCASVCPEKAIDLKLYDWGRNPELTGQCKSDSCTRCYDVCAAKVVPLAAMEKHFFGRNRKEYRRYRTQSCNAFLLHDGQRKAR